jgi:hypothetical protein
LVFVTEIKMDINIRNEESKDIEQVRAILKATFPTGAEGKLVDALRANGKAIILSPVSTTHRTRQKGSGLRLWQFVLTFNHKASARN